MNEQAITDAWNLSKKNGYAKSLEDFKKLIATNPNALKDSYELSKKYGYKKSLNDYKILMGVGTQPTTKYKFLPCVAKRGTPKVNKSGAIVIQYKVTVWDSPTIVLYQSNDGVSCRFMVVDGKYKSRKGTAKCTPTNKIFYQLDVPGSKPQDNKKGGSGVKKRTWKNVTFTLADILSGKATIKWGDKGPVVSEVQEIMNSLNLGSISKSGQPDGKFGKRTDLSVKQFQGNNMPKGSMTGVVDSATLKRMIDLRDYDSLKGEKSSSEKYSPQGVPDDAFNPQMPNDGQNVEPTQSNVLSVTQDPLQEDIKKIVSENLKSLLK